ncbi:ATP-binding cassette domain-containing protein [Effusibacillus pohliae]|uniref:ATP-binding cassette domain-containing protein n=1 Tax=Effusibacillus pohliae TaxID=232270 RepID=UPI00037C1955|nr:ATP-binding cassette domain-containing protein [Effusibacillus pohliae]
MIDVQNVTYIYRDGTRRVPALRGIDLQIRRGEWVAVTGPNGSGKSTLVHLLNGLAVPAEGRVSVAGLDLAVPAHRERVKQHVQVVFQNPDAQTVGTTPAEDVAFGLENRGVPREEMESRVERALRQVGLLDKRFAPVSSLSGGQKQRLAIASCLALEPDCLIFDEATSMLDPAGRRQIYAIARSLWESGVTVVWITQRLPELLEAGRIVVLEAGQIVYGGDARTLFYDSDIPQRCQWDVPPLVKIGLWLKQRGLPLESLPLREEEVEELLCAWSCQTQDFAMKKS